MGHLLGVTLLAVTLLGCGSDDHVGAIGDPAPSPAVVVHATAGRGEVSDRVTVLADRAAVRKYAAGFSHQLAGKIKRAAKQLDVPDDHELVAGVVAVGCDVPPRVVASGSGDDVVFTPAKVLSPLPECFAPVTTVALAVMPA